VCAQCWTRRRALRPSTWPKRLKTTYARSPPHALSTRRSSTSIATRANSSTDVYVLCCAVLPHASPPPPLPRPLRAHRQSSVAVGCGCAWHRVAVSLAPVSVTPVIPFQRLFRVRASSVTAAQATARSPANRSNHSPSPLLRRPLQRLPPPPLPLPLPLRRASTAIRKTPNRRPALRLHRSALRSSG
jgi:hypothetical protein